MARGQTCAIEDLLAAVRSFSAGEAQGDDVTALVLRYRGAIARPAKRRVRTVLAWLAPSMPDEDSRLIRQIYAGAIQHDPEERDEFLDRACADRPELRARVAALLEAHALDLDIAPAAQAHDSRTASSGLAPAATAVEGRKIGSYMIRRELGRGGMGVVYLAHDVRLSRTVAIKALSPSMSHTPDLRGRLLNEAKVAAALSHPGIATVYALEEIDGELYLAHEYVPGSPLRALLQSGPLPIEEVVDIGVQVAKALSEAHTQGIVHRDVKPENIIKTPSGVVKVLDFGLARADHSMQGFTQTGVVMGTPAYLAPEQALGQPTDFRTDIFALGLLLYELASGANPFVAKSVTATIARIVEEDPPPLSQVQPRSVPELDRILEKCVRKDPQERYGSTQQIVVDLERLRADLAWQRPRSSGPVPDAATPPRPRTNPQRWLVNHQVIMSAIYIAMLYPAWYAKSWLAPPWNMLFLLSVLSAAAAATSLRLHLWFTAFSSPHHFAAQHSRTLRATRGCDVVFAVTQVTTALVVGGSHPEFAMLFVAVSVAVLVASLVIEPATARSAFEESDRDR